MNYTAEQIAWGKDLTGELVTDSPRWMWEFLKGQADRRDEDWEAAVYRKNREHNKATGKLLFENDDARRAYCG